MINLIDLCTNNAKFNLNNKNLFLAFYHICGININFIF